MALSNKFGSLVLTTGNKSEIAVGYCTLYGDMCGGLAVISDVPKTMVYRLARIANARYEAKGLPGPIPENTFTKPPSAELRPDQKDTDSLPEYEVLDAILARLHRTLQVGPPKSPRRKICRKNWCATSSGKSIATSTSASKPRPVCASPPKRSALAAASRSRTGSLNENFH